MATAEQLHSDRFAPLMEEVARTISRQGIQGGAAAKGKGELRIENEFSVRRVIQAYWTPFEANVPGRSIGLHLEVAEPRVRWAECYLSPAHRNWFFTFSERPDGELQLAYYADYPDPAQALPRFFNLADWYVLTAAGLTWKDVVYQVDPQLRWDEHLKGLASPLTGAAVQESLKKSTIVWLRWIGRDRVERTMPVWFLYDTKANRIFVLSGERQQMIPDAENLREVVVVLRWKGKNAQVAEIPASVTVLAHGPEWDEIAEKIAEKRLNIPGLPEDTARRWRDECHILELKLRA